MKMGKKTKPTEDLETFMDQANGKRVMPNKVEVSPQAKISVQANFANARKAMCTALVERDEEIDLVLTALVAKEHVLLVGNPGTAKSFLLRTVANWFNYQQGDYFERLLTKFTVPEELFGPISISKMKMDLYVRIIRGKLPEAKLVFLDEFFKASSAIANTLLTAMHERLYDNGNGPEPIPLLTLLAAGNEWPNDQDGGKELGALFDRFLFRKQVRNVSKSGRKELLSRAVANNNCQAVFTETINEQEIEEAHNEAIQLPWHNQAKKALWEILEELNKEGIAPGDRRQFKAIKAARANAYLHGSKEVLPEHLEVLAHVLWDDPTEQPEKCAKIVNRIANPHGMRVNDLQLQANDISVQTEKKLNEGGKNRTTVCSEAIAKLEAVKKELEILKQDDKRDAALEYIDNEIKTWTYRAINAPLKGK